MKSELGIDLISAETPILHSALKQLSLENPRFFGDYRFDERGDFPYSHEFYSQLLAQEMAECLSCLSPDFEWYLILDKAVVSYEKWIKPLFTPDELKNLKKIAVVLGAKIGKSIKSTTPAFRRGLVRRKEWQPDHHDARVD